MPGTRKSLSINRALVLDLLHFARSVPSFSVEREFELRRVAQLRKAVATSPSWAVLFVKAYAIVVERHPVLRQVFLPYPTAHLYEETGTVAAVAIARTYRNEDRLCWGRFPEPAGKSLLELQGALERYQALPVDDVFRRQVRLSRFPAWLRRLAWRIGLYVAASQRARRFGNFSVSSLGREGALNRTHPSIHTTSLTYGPVDTNGKCTVTLLCDHRVLDGAAATRALRDLEGVLNEEIAGELADLQTMRFAA